MIHGNFIIFSEAKTYLKVLLKSFPRRSQCIGNILYVPAYELLVIPKYNISNLNNMHHFQKILLIFTRTRARTDRHSNRIYKHF